MQEAEGGGDMRQEEDDKREEGGEGREEEGGRREEGGNRREEDVPFGFPYQTRIGLQPSSGFSIHTPGSPQPHPSPCDRFRVGCYVLRTRCPTT